MSETSELRPASGDDLRRLLDQAPWVVGLLDAQHRHRFVNVGACQVTGIPAEEILGRTDEELGFGFDDAEHRAMADAAMASGETASAERWVETANGRLHFVRQELYPNRDAHGRVDGYWQVVRNLTELKLAEARSAAMIATALDCIIVIDAEGRVLEFNPAAERTFGYARDEVIGRPMAELIVPPGLRTQHLEGLQRFLATDQARLIGRRVEIDAMRADGSTFPAELAIAEIRLAGERTFTAYLRDLTPARAAQMEIRRQREALLQSEKMAAFGSLLAGLAHELNNPLSIVLGHALMLKDAASGTALAERAEKIEQAAERCARIARNFLAMARREELQMAPVDLPILIDDVLGLLSPDLNRADIELQLEIPPGLPKVEGDADRLHQVLTNLTTNARQALEASARPRILSIAARELADALELTVADNGPGVPQGVRSRVFDPFFTTKDVGSGTGIGLTVSRGIVESHGGSLTLANDGEGQGACFVLRLPLAGDAQAPVVIAAEES